MHKGSSAARSAAITSLQCDHATQQTRNSAQEANSMMQTSSACVALPYALYTMPSNSSEHTPSIANIHGKLHLHLHFQALLPILPEVLNPV
mmetsp:Transcript_5546/g.12283  ORF Transcript_5546/g.12283 Transcript_5546/m.12283 type:complete len:91 (+) Transcript_5546:474-746(+)